MQKERPLKQSAKVEHNDEKRLTKGDKMLTIVTIFQPRQDRTRNKGCAVYR